MSDVFQNIQLQRIAEAMENGGQALSINLDITGIGDMTGATASAPGAHGLVPAPAAGDEQKVLSGSGAWVEQSGGGGGGYEILRNTEVNTGNKWVDGSDIYVFEWESLGQIYPGEYSFEFRFFNFNPAKVLKVEIISHDYDWYFPYFLHNCRFQYNGGNNEVIFDNPALGYVNVIIYYTKAS